MPGNNDYGWTTSKAATISLKDKICPECLRLKATNAREAGTACYCPKWYAVNDADAKRDCDNLHQKKSDTGIVGEQPATSEYDLYKKQYGELRGKELEASLKTALRGADEYQSGLRREIERQMTFRESAEAALKSTQSGMQSTIDHWMDRAIKAEMALADKNETANTFMEQVKSLQSELCKISGALNAADGDDLVQIVKDVCAQKQSLANQNADLLAKTSETK